MIILSGIGAAIPFEALLELGGTYPQVVFEADAVPSADAATRSWQERFFNARYPLRRGARIDACGMGSLAVRLIEVQRLLRGCEHVRLTCQASEVPDGTMDGVRNHLFAAFRATASPRRLLVPWARASDSWLPALHGIVGLGVVVRAEQSAATPQQPLPGITTVAAGPELPRDGTSPFLLTPTGEVGVAQLYAACRQLERHCLPQPVGSVSERTAGC